MSYAPSKTRNTARLPEPIVWQYELVGSVQLVEVLSPRELEVLRLMAEGLENKEIASALGIAWMTARGHIYNMLQKLGARNRTHAVTIGLRAGLIRLQEPTDAQTAIAMAAYYAALANKLLAEGRP